MVALWFKVMNLAFFAQAVFSTALLRDTKEMLTDLGENQAALACGTLGESRSLPRSWLLSPFSKIPSSSRTSAGPKGLPRMTSPFGTCECDLFEKRVFSDVIKNLKTILSWTGMSPKSSDKYPCKGGEAMWGCCSHKPPVCGHLFQQS